MNTGMSGLALDTLAPGVEGYLVAHKGVVHYPLVLATHEGNGDVSRWLDSLPTTLTLKFPCVLSVKLQGMLMRRGFVPVTEWVDEIEEEVEFYTREARTP